VAPTFTMPDPVTRRRLAALADLNNALSGARCAAQLAGLEAGEFLVRELLLRVIDQIDRAAVMARRLL
jgi:nitrogen-specific signal transduction histidine kinase